MSVITSILGRVEDFPATLLDPLLLTSQQRASGHFAASTSHGKNVRVSLPRGVELQDGDVLALEENTAIVVAAAPEDLLYVTARDKGVMWWVACYQLGNLHRPARFLEEGILTPYDPMALTILKGFGVDIERVKRPFVGRRFGAVQSHHDHEPHAHPHTHAGDVQGAHPPRQGHDALQPAHHGTARPAE
jgi:urease accessory protein